MKIMKCLDFQFSCSKVWNFPHFTYCFSKSKKQLILFYADSCSLELHNGIVVVSVLSSVNTVLFYFSSHLISISVVFYSFKKSETICSKRK